MTYTQLEKDLITHAVAKCQRSLRDTCQLVTPDQQITIIHAVSSTLFTASLGAVLGCIPKQDRSKLLNEVLREIYHKAMEVAEMPIDSQKPPI